MSPGEFIRRGEVWWAKIRPPVGSEPGFDRPVVIIQADAFNRSRIHTTIVMGLTSNLSLTRMPGIVLLPQRDTGLPKPSVANPSQLITLDKSALQTRVGVLPPALMIDIERALRQVLGLT